jgi:opacity protein-like surface antigen
VLDVTLLSGTAAWYITGRGPIRPYVTGGLGVVRSRSLASVTYTSPAGWTLEEREERDTGMGLTAGAGVRFLVGDHVVIRPEWRLYDGSIRGRANLGVMRTSVSVGYGW